jgi:hypothetical protein
MSRGTWVEVGVELLTTFWARVVQMVANRKLTMTKQTRSFIDFLSLVR